MPKKNNPENRYPDARLKSINEFWDLLKNEINWKPNCIDKNTFKTLGIAKSKEGNTIYALEFLGIINQNGIPTDEFQGLRNNFQKTLEKLVRKSYSEVFETIPASRMNQATLVKFFVVRKYSEDTAEYQAKLFVKLCQDANIDLPNVEGNFQRARFKKAKESIRRQ